MRFIKALLYRRIPGRALRLSTSVLSSASIQNSRAQIQRAHSFSSVSEAEVNKFSKAAKTWWDPRENPLVSMNPIRMKYILSQMGGGRSSLEGIKALDVGCGGGLLSESLARLGADVTGVDPSKDLVEQAKVHASLDRRPSSRVKTIDYRGGWTVEQLAEEYKANNVGEGGLYDVICLLEVIEHVTEVDSVLSAVSDLLKPDGTLFLSTINRTLKSRAIAIVGAEYIMRYLPPGTHDWDTFRSPAEVDRYMARAGLESVDVCGMVITSPPPIPFMPPGLSGKWDWKLDPDDVDVNWIGAYRHKK